MDVAEAIDEEAVEVTLSAAAAGSYDAGGNWVAGGPTSGPIQAAIQPASGRVLQDLPEGLRAEVTLVGWSRSQVALGNEITYSGSNYRVVHVWPRPADGFYKFALGGKD